MAKEAMNDFLQEVGTMLFKYLIKRGLSREDAEDIVQDTCYKFLLHKAGIRSDRVMGWLFRVATNQFYDLKRKQTRHPTVDVNDVPLISLTDIPEIQMINNETSRCIRDTLETLSSFHQDLLILKYELNLTYRTISSLLDMNENTLKTHVTRAKDKFISNYKEEF